MSRSKRVSALIGVVTAAVLITGIATTAGQASKEATGKQTKGYKIFAMPPIIGVPYTIALEKGAKQAAKELGDSITYTGPTTLSPTVQVSLLNTALRQGYKGIAIGPDDPAALLPILKRAKAKGIKIITFGADLATTKDRIAYVSPPDYKTFGYDMIEWLGQQIGYKGDFAILSSNTTKLDQVTWIKYMKQALATPKYKNMKLVKIAYGNEVPSQDISQTQALLQAYPDLKGIISPTAVGLPDVARAVTTAGKCGQIAVTGQALPSTMKTYVKSGCVKKFGLWSPIDLGYLAMYTLHDLISGQLKGKLGDTFKAGRLGKRTIVKGPSGPAVLVGKPLVFTKANINKYHF